MGIRSGRAFRFPEGKRKLRTIVFRLIPSAVVEERNIEVGSKIIQNPSVKQLDSFIFGKFLVFIAPRM
jgi:hypothetical protein